MTPMEFLTHIDKLTYQVTCNQNCKRCPLNREMVWDDWCLINLIWEQSWERELAHVRRLMTNVDRNKNPEFYTALAEKEVELLEHLGKMEDSRPP